MLSAPSTLFERNGLLLWYAVLLDGWCSSVFLLACHMDLFCGGRLAAFAARFAQSIVAPWEVKMQVFGDDPILIAFGQRLRLVAVVLLIWAALGFDLSCKNGQKGPRVEWIGGEFSLLQDGVAVQLTEAKTQAAKDSVDEILHGQAMLLVKKLVSLSGYMSWIVSVAPVARPFVSMLWRAVIDHTQWTPRSNTTRKRLDELVFATRISHAVRWLRASSRPGSLRGAFTLSVRRGAPRFQIRTDASPCGLGRLIIRHHGRPVAYWADAVSAGEFTRVRAAKGDHANWVNKLCPRACVTANGGAQSPTEVTPNRLCSGLLSTLTRILKICNKLATFFFFFEKKKTTNSFGLNPNMVQGVRSWAMALYIWRLLGHLWPCAPDVSFF